MVYLTLPKGSLTDDHVLICPIGHHSNQISLPDEAVQEVNKFKSALRKMYKKHGKSVVFFERNYKQTHLQIQVCVQLYNLFISSLSYMYLVLQVVPVSKEVASKVKSAWLETASSLELNEIPDHVPLGQLAVQAKAYLHVETPEWETLFGRIQRNFLLQFGREVMADFNLLSTQKMNTIISFLRNKDIFLCRSFKQNQIVVVLLAPIGLVYCISV